MTEITISYSQSNEDQLANCQIDIATNMVSELLQHFKRLFSSELAKAEVTEKGKMTSIKFQASKSKVKTLEKIIITTKQMTARLN